MAQQAAAPVPGEFTKHAGHGQEHRHPVVHGPEVVDPHPDEEDHDLPFCSCGGTARYRFREHAGLQIPYWIVLLSNEHMIG